MKDLTLNYAKVAVGHLKEAIDKSRLTQVQQLQRALAAQTVLTVGSQDPGLKKLSEFFIREFPAFLSAQVENKGFPITDEVFAKRFDLPWGSAELSIDDKNMHRLFEDFNRFSGDEKEK